MIALAYGVGSGIVLFGLSLGGRALLDRVRRAGRGPVVQRTLAGVLIATGVAMSLSLDTRFQTALANHVPDALVNPTKALEDTGAVGDRLADLRGESKFDSARATTTAHASAAASALPVLGQAPDFTGNQRWFNTGGGRPLSLAGLQGPRGARRLLDLHVHQLHPHVPRAQGARRAYRDAGLTIVGVHTPEFAFERKASNVASAIEQNELRYPVAQDNDFATWNAWGNQYWPAKYLIDAEGRVRYTHFGEGGYAETEAAVRALLAESGARDIGAPAGAEGTPVTTQRATPETYLGTQRAAAFAGDPLRNGVHDYREVTAPLAPNAFSLAGTWKVDGESAEAVAGAKLQANITAQHVYLVLSSRDEKPRSLQVLVDGRPTRTVTVRRQRLYTLASFPRAGAHRLELRPEPGIAGFAFTFG